MIATATLLGIAAATAIVGAGVSAYGMYNQGQAQKKMSEYNAQVQQNNATMADQQARFEAQQVRVRNNRLRGAQAAAFGASGVDLSGSASDVMYDSALQGDLDEQSAFYKGEVSTTQQESAAALTKAQGRAAEESSYFGVAGTLLSGAGQSVGYLGKYDKFSQPSLN